MIPFDRKNNVSMKAELEEFGGGVGGGGGGNNCSDDNDNGSDEKLRVEMVEAIQL